MNSRERVLLAINHQEADRLPIDVGATRQTGIAASTYHLLKRRLGLSTPTRVYDVYQMLADIEQPILDRFGADCVGLNRPAVAFGIRNEGWKPWTLPDGTPVEVPGGFNPSSDRLGNLVLYDAGGAAIAKMPKGGLYFDRLGTFPGAARADPAGLKIPLLSAEECDHFHAQAEAAWQNTDKATVAAMGPPYELFFGLGTGDFSSWMMTLACEPDYVESLYERLVDAWLENLRRFTDAVGDRVPILQFNDDLGTQNGPFLSVKMFRDLVMPYYKRGLDWIHSNTRMKVFMHNDGAIFDFIPSLIEMGVDILNPVQTTAKGMEPKKLKEQFGKRLVFWGGACDCQAVLPFGTPDDVAEEVRRHVEFLSPGGGYVFASVHNIQAQVPAENVIALFETALEAGRYGQPAGDPRE
ncbi:MAG: methyltransferase [Pirellulaceae bacterium]|jgi:uroporphyrinogen decarboxylase|nr:uroporphyrinogen decarboxylase family protein [Thermoguttaceae bacterium]MDI9443978.1 uroporphyrinogen decarboxylase family protein [Planctomycetota bacterium]NLZ00030.1 methyltransferase [Pirellulaceae bacterium]